ncbi:MAG: hypothetical protein ACTSYX_03005 [Candidatus Thorarchaeota archaeon]
MDRETRLELIRTTLDDMIRGEGRQASFVVFEDPEREKFVQFAFVGGDLVCDIPIDELSELEEERVGALPEISTSESNGNVVAYQRWFSPDELDEAAQFTEFLFVDVFQMPPGYTLRVSFQELS